MRKLLAIVCALVFPPTLAFGQQTITIRASDAMIVLGQRCANLYQSSHADARISVNGGGPDRGMDALVGHTADIAQLAQPMPRATRDKRRFRASAG